MQGKLLCFAEDTIRYPVQEYIINIIRKLNGALLSACTDAYV